MSRRSDAAWCAVMGVAVLVLSSCLARDGSPEGAWSPLPSPDRATVSALSVAPGGRLFAGSYAGLFSLEESEGSWRLRSPPEWVVTSVLAVTDSTILLGTYRRGIRRSDDGGATWSSVGFEGNVYVDALTRDESGRIFAAVAHSVDDQPTGVFRSDDQGISWVASGLAGEHVHSISFVGPDSMYAGTESGTFRSIDGGASWIRVTGLPESVPLSALVRVGRTLIAGFGEPRHRAPGVGAWASIDGGATWRQMPGLPPATAVHSLVVADGGVLAATGDVLGRGGAGVYSSKDHEQWEPAALPGQWLRPMILAADGQVYVGAAEEGVFSGRMGDPRWVPRSAGLRNWNPTALTVDREGRLYALTARSLLGYEARSSDWPELPLPSEAAAPTPFSFAALADGSLLIPGEGALLMREAAAAQWTRKAVPGASGPAIAIHVDRTDRVFATFPGQGVFESGDRGDSWNRLDVPEQTRGVTTTASGTLISFGEGVSRRSESGRWQATDLDAATVFEVIECGGALYLGSAPRGVFQSRDDGRSWIPSMDRLREDAQQPGYIAVHSLLCAPDGALIAVTFSDGLFRFTEEAGWTDLTGNLPSRSLGDVTLAPDGLVYVSTSAGVYGSRVAPG